MVKGIQGTIAQGKLTSCNASQHLAAYRYILWLRCILGKVVHHCVVCAGTVVCLWALSKVLPKVGTHGNSAVAAQICFLFITPLVRLGDSQYHPGRVSEHHPRPLSRVTHTTQYVLSGVQIRRQLLLVQVTDVDHIVILGDRYCSRVYGFCVVVNPLLMCGSRVNTTDSRHMLTH